MAVAKRVLRYLKDTDYSWRVILICSSLPIVIQTGGHAHHQMILNRVFCYSWWLSYFLEDQDADYSVSSSAEAEYWAMVAATSELIWICSLLASLRVFVKLPMSLFCDNRRHCIIAKNPVFYERAKHNKIDCHFIWERILSGELITDYLPSKYQIADIFTKALGKRQFVFLQSMLGIVNPHVRTWRGVIRIEYFVIRIECDKDRKFCDKDRMW